MSVSHRMTFLAATLLVLALSVAHADDKREKGRDNRWTESTLRCESRNARAQFCAADIRGWVRVRNQLSSAPCVIGRNWRHDRRGVYVSGGCRADFVYQTRSDDSKGNGWESFEVLCESHSYEYSQCYTDARGRVELSRQISRTNCERDWTWGVMRGAIWVSEGCRAYFSIEGFRDNRPSIRGKGSAPPGILRKQPK